MTKDRELDSDDSKDETQDQGAALGFDLLKELGIGSALRQPLFDLPVVRQPLFDLPDVRSLDSLFSSKVKPLWNDPEVAAMLGNLYPNLPRAAAMDQLGAQLKNVAMRSGEWKSPRQKRKASDLFEPVEVVVDSIANLETALSRLLVRNGELGLVWRGQRDQSWGINSSLTRAILAAKKAPTEELMTVIELEQAREIRAWGQPTYDDLHTLADLQHHGVQTRLIDVSLDPRVATFFATELTGDTNADGRIVAWGRTTQPKRGESVVLPSMENLDRAFWRYWAPEDRDANAWGTGERLHGWFPPALNERMRAQRAGFLLDAQPRVPAAVIDRITSETGQDWTEEELAQATRVVGIPSRPDRKVKRDSDGIVPMFTIRIKASAKPEIQAHLARQGLNEASMYPDRQGLMSYLARLGANVAPNLGEI